MSLRISAHYLDWQNKPAPFKFYRNLTRTPLPRTFPHPDREALAALSADRSDESPRGTDLATLAEILFFSAGLTRKARFGKEFYYMRAASATGALYPIELYIVCSGTEGLDAGVYHFDPMNFSLVRLRDGDHTALIADATGNLSSSILTIVFTSLAWRNAWKYEARSYRHWFWDAGVIAANMLATCFSEGIPAKLKMGFVDAEIDRLFGLKPAMEATVALATIGEPTSDRNHITKREMIEIDPDTGPSSNTEVEYPIVWEANNASVLRNSSEVEKWGKSATSTITRPNPGLRRFPILATEMPSSPLGNTILQRGSTRKFAQRPVSFEALSAIIHSSTRPIPIDFLRGEESLVEFYLIANDVDGLPPGSYRYNRQLGALEQLKEGKMRYISGYLCLEQLLFSDASVVFFLMTELDEVLGSLGGRGYRAAQFEAGVRAGKIYLAAYAQGIGASGSTFYDDAVSEFFSPEAKALSPMIAVGVGVPAYKAKPGRILPQFGN